MEGWRVRKNGAPFYVTGVLTAIRDDDQKLIGFASIIRDATERRDAQEKLVEAREQLAMAQKMEAIGKLTGGIAHDFNNLLMIIGGNAETFRRLLDPKLPRALEAIQTAAKRGESLTRQLLTFSRSQHLSPRVLDLTASIRNMRTLIESSLRGNIVYNEKIDPDIWPVKVDLAELELAIVNIAVNSRDAMPNGGVFTLTASNIKANDGRLGEQRNGEFVALEFSDTGMGIPPDSSLQDIRSVFHDQGGREGNRARSISGIWVCPPSRRVCTGGKQSRTRNGDQRLFAPLYRQGPCAGRDFRDRRGPFAASGGPRC